MQALKDVVGWLARKGLIYVLLVAALIVATVFTPLIESQWTRPGQTRQRLADLSQVQNQLVTERSAIANGFNQSVAQMRDATVREVDERLAIARARVERLERERPKFGVLGSLAAGGSQAVLDDQRREVDIAVGLREIASLKAARKVATANAELLIYKDINTRVRSVNLLWAHCRAARQKFIRFEEEWFGKRWWESETGARLAAERDKLCGDHSSRKALLDGERKARNDALEVRRKLRGEFDVQARNIEATLASTTTGLQAQLVDDSAVLNGSLRQKAELFAERINLAGKMKAAALALLGIVAMPYLIRLLFFWALAPVAARRPSIRLQVPGGRGAAISLPARSTTSVGVLLEPHEELLVRQDYLQSTAEAGKKATRWLLDWSHPFSSIATGLTFLTRIRGDGTLTTVSAVRDPFAEVTILSLPAGAACVLQPRALAAVAQPIDRGLQITSHWRLASLNAWLTLQLRYLVFHGPVRLVLKGGRGVRVERAEAGRMFGQDQLVGFSTDLAYSVTRTETFWPYFLGREQLFRDKVDAGDGLLIVEEAPMAGRKAGEVRRGLEGVMDAALKVVGL
jgi:hypothetical protein